MKVIDPLPSEVVIQIEDAPKRVVPRVATDFDIPQLVTGLVQQMVTWRLREKVVGGPQIHRQF